MHREYEYRLWKRVNSTFQLCLNARDDITQSDLLEGFVDVGWLNGLALFLYSRVFRPIIMQRSELFQLYTDDKNNTYM